MSSNVIFGAGKISRGFLAHLLTLSNQDFVFIEKNAELVELINTRTRYGLYVFGAPEKNIVIENAQAINSDDTNAVIQAMAQAKLLLISIGGKNLSEIISLLIASLETRFESGNDSIINIITCENWHGPAEAVRDAIFSGIDAKYIEIFKDKVGIAESVILRTAIEADESILTEDPLSLNVSDFWELPINGSRVKGKLPDVKGFKLIDPFNKLLDRKLYTFNAASATVSYLAYLKGHEILSEGIRDKYIEKILMGVYEETAVALCGKYDVEPEEHSKLQKASFEKYRDRNIVDMIERNARDPIRKLGPNDRLVGPARLVLEYGGNPANLATAIAAGLFYDHPADPIALDLKAKRQAEGIDSLLSDVCGIDPNDTLGLLIKDRIEELKAIGVIKDTS